MFHCHGNHGLPLPHTSDLVNWCTQIEEITWHLIWHHGFGLNDCCHTNSTSLHFRPANWGWLYSNLPSNQFVSNIWSLRVLWNQFLSTKGLVLWIFGGSVQKHPLPEAGQQRRLKFHNFFLLNYPFSKGGYQTWCMWCMWSMDLPCRLVPCLGWLSCIMTPCSTLLRLQLPPRPCGGVMPPSVVYGTWWSQRNGDGVCSSEPS